MRRGLSAKKREEPFVFPRLSLPPVRARPRAQPDRQPEPGTGTLPDAGGAGGGGHATRFPPARARRHSTIPEFYPHRTPRKDYLLNIHLTQ